MVIGSAIIIRLSIVNKIIKTVSGKVIKLAIRGEPDSVMARQWLPTRAITCPMTMALTAKYQVVPASMMAISGRNSAVPNRFHPRLRGSEIRKIRFCPWIIKLENPWAIKYATAIGIKEPAKKFATFAEDPKEKNRLETTQDK